ncbi:iron chelate uptake ABC transporter family permease subunit [Dactylosporangium fulvum]|uniref:Iron chelate uptake ABC transporter family permease subunit n=1 Tax=Dactylosporangium fulvum TaxID=53359 RepID=A0ABY5VYB9_9ACTN|nr:iron chelate uptake ABC transporter family permease subunit [Dactylosporangium fulvum]UWP82145.1 iron chelate uptake ABC transporter family permease subunit [Dactylosporangium fulvum]
MSRPAVAERPVVSGRVLRSSADRLSVRWHPRTVLVCALLLGAVVVLAALSLTSGAYPVPLGRVVATLSGHGTRIEEFIIVKLRLPRLTAAVLVGWALGMSGAVFQGLTRNPLGSPDIVGFTSGAACGAVLEILFGRGGAGEVALAAVGGGLVVAAVVTLLSTKQRRITGYRLILVGIGIAAMLQSLTTYLLTRATLYDAQNAAVWLIGSLNAVGWGTVAPLAIALAVLAPMAILAGRALGWLAVGDEAAKGLGLPVERSRYLLIFTATALAAVAVAAAGPITFVALAAPQLCRPLTRSSGAQIVPAGAMGAALLLGADFAAQRIVPTSQLPVGVLTGVVGGLYLCWLLAHEWKTGRS